MLPVPSPFIKMVNIFDLSRSQHERSAETVACPAMTTDVPRPVHISHRKEHRFRIERLDHTRKGGKLKRRGMFSSG